MSRPEKIPAEERASRYSYAEVDALFADILEHLQHAKLGERGHGSQRVKNHGEVVEVFGTTATESQTDVFDIMVELLNKHFLKYVQAPKESNRLFSWREYFREGAESVGASRNGFDILSLHLGCAILESYMSFCEKYPQLLPAFVFMLKIAGSSGTTQTIVNASYALQSPETSEKDPAAIIEDRFTRGARIGYHKGGTVDLAKLEDPHQAYDFKVVCSGMLVAEYIRQWLYQLIDHATGRSVYAESCEKMQLPFAELSELSMGKWWRQLYIALADGATFTQAKQELYASWTTEDNWDLVLTLAEKAVSKISPVSGYLPYIYALIDQGQDELAMVRLSQLSQVYVESGK